MLNNWADQLSGFFTGVATTTLLVCAGLAIGMYVGRLRRRADSSSEAELEHIKQVAGGLAQWSNGMANDVSQYSSVVGAVTSWLRQQEQEQAEVPSEAKEAVQLLSQIAEANELLQQRLESAETALIQQAEEILSYMDEARTDPLTGLANRRAFDDELKRRVAEWQRHGKPLSLLMIDIDYFKRFNDDFGHQAGDAVLANVAFTLRRTIRESDLVARYGGEEFAVLLPCGDLQEARQAGARIQQVIADTELPVEDHFFQVTISCGAAQVAENETGSECMQRADLALYAAKDAGRNQAWYHDGCRPLAVDPQQSSQVGRQARHPNKPTANALGEDFRHACDDLRKQLEAIAGS